MEGETSRLHWEDVGEPQYRRSLVHSLAYWPFVVQELRYSKKRSKKIFPCNLKID